MALISHCLRRKKKSSKSKNKKTNKKSAVRKLKLNFSASLLYVLFSGGKVSARSQCDQLNDGIWVYSVQTLTASIKARRKAQRPENVDRERRRRRRRRKKLHFHFRRCFCSNPPSSFLAFHFNGLGLVHGSGNLNEHNSNFKNVKKKHVRQNEAKAESVGMRNEWMNES